MDFDWTEGLDLDPKPVPIDHDLARRVQEAFQRQKDSPLPPWIKLGPPKSPASAGRRDK